MMTTTPPSPHRTRRAALAALCALALAAGACSSGDETVGAQDSTATSDDTTATSEENTTTEDTAVPTDDTTATSEDTPTTSEESTTPEDTTAVSEASTTTDIAAENITTSPEADDSSTGDDEPDDTEPETAGDAIAVTGLTACDDIAALFTTSGSANPDLGDPESSAVCDGDDLVITANGIPDYPYIETSPGPPRAQDLSYTIPSSPTMAAETTAVPLVGALGVSLNGIPLYGPTEGTGGDVGSLPGILMDCGGHNGPTGFHMHLVGTSETTECDFTAEELAAGPQLLGYAFDGVPIYTGNAQYTSSWELTDESLFATDTWSAHTYVEGLGDLDECNGLTDADGNYAYYTTDTFPYFIGCFVGEVEIAGPGGGGGGPGGGGGGGERPPRDDDGGA